MQLRCKACSRDQRKVPADNRARAIFDNELKWVSGTDLTYSFIGGSDSYHDAVRAGFEQWMQYAAITFTEVADNGQIRVAFDPTDGSWSYLGRDLLNTRSDEPTMNIGWDPYGDPDVAPHEIGHVLGLHHEHQNAGIEWDRDQVIADLSGPPNNWDVPTIEQNVLDIIPRSQVIGSEIIDPNSIMMYDIPASWIKSGDYTKTGIHPQPGISAADMYWAGIVYPPLDNPGPPEPPDPTAPFKVSVELNLAFGQQSRLDFMVPKAGDYKLGTIGDADTVIVLFEDGIQIDQDDDSGESRNALLARTLEANKEYSLVVRLYSFWSAGKPTLYVEK